MNKTRNDWLVLLAKMSTPSDPVKAYKAMQAFLPLLEDLPDEAFTAKSLEHVAMAPQALHIRTLREVKEPLQAWWKDNRPLRTAIAAPVKREEEPEPVSEAERQAVRRQMAELADKLAPREQQRPTVRAHVVPAEVLAATRAKLRGVG